MDMNIEPQVIAQSKHNTRNECTRLRKQDAQVQSLHDILPIARHVSFSLASIKSPPTLFHHQPQIDIAAERGPAQRRRGIRSEPAEQVALGTEREARTDAVRPRERLEIDGGRAEFPRGNGSVNALLDLRHGGPGPGDDGVKMGEERVGEDVSLHVPNTIAITSLMGGERVGDGRQSREDGG